MPTMHLHLAMLAVAVTSGCNGLLGTTSKASEDEADSGNQSFEVPLSCALEAKPDYVVAPFSSDFLIWDTSETGINAAYGQPACADHYVVELDPTLFTGTLSVSGIWNIAGDTCEAMTSEVAVFSRRAGDWSLERAVSFKGAIRGTNTCQPQAQIANAQDSYAWIPLAAGSDRVRFAVVSHSDTTKVPLKVGILISQ